MSPAKRLLAWRADYSESDVGVLDVGRVPTCMATFLRRTRTWLAVTAGLSGIGLALWNWLHYLTAAPPRIPCGNCFLGGVGVATELAILGIILISRARREVPVFQGDAIWWFGAVFGAYFTPYVVGLPLCVVSLAALVQSD